MSELQVTAERAIGAPATQVYRLIADFDRHHPLFLPRAFSQFRVVAPEGPGCRVRVETRWQSAGGVGGLFERLYAPRVLRRLYADELERLDRYARTAPPD